MQVAAKGRRRSSTSPTGARVRLPSYAEALSYAGNILRDIRRFDEAAEKLSAATIIFQQGGDLFRAAMTARDAEAALSHAGRFEEATFARSYTASRPVIDRRNEGTTLQRMSELLLALGRGDEAEWVSDDAISIFQEVGDLHEEAAAKLPAHLHC